MKSVVSSIKYDDLWGHDGTWACSHTTTEVPDMTDLSYKADKTDVIKLGNQLYLHESEDKRQRDKLKEKIEVVVEYQKNFVDAKTLATMKSELLSNDRLKREKDLVAQIGEELVAKIKKQCEKERVAIHKEVVAFSEIDINNELKRNLIPLSLSINNLLEKVNSIKKQLDDLRKTKKEMDDVYEKIQNEASEIQGMMEYTKQCADKINQSKNEINTVLRDISKSKNSVDQKCQRMDMSVKAVKDIEQSVSKIQLDITGLQKKIVNNVDYVKSTSLQISKDKERMERMCEDVEQKTKSYQDAFSHLTSKSKVIMSEMETMRGKLENEANIVSEQVSACGREQAKIMKTSETLRSSVTNVEKIKQQLTNKIEYIDKNIKQVSESNLDLLEKQKVGFEKLINDQNKNFITLTDEIQNKIQNKIQKTIHDSVFTVISSMNLWDRIKWMFGCRL